MQPPAGATVITATLIGAGSTAWAMQDAPAEPATDPASETTTDDPVATEESEVEAPPSTADAMGAGGPAITPPASTPAEKIFVAPPCRRVHCSTCPAPSSQR